MISLLKIICITITSLFIFPFTIVNAEPTAKVYWAKKVEVLDNSAKMLRVKKNWLGMKSSGPVGTKGIPDIIQIGDRITVEGVTITVNFISVTKHLKDLRYGGKTYQRKGDISCTFYQNRTDIHTGKRSDDWRLRTWINASKCRPLN